VDDLRGGDMTRRRCQQPGHRRRGLAARRRPASGAQGRTSQATSCACAGCAQAKAPAAAHKLPRSSSLGQRRCA
jgi:hypothetical protein